MVGAGMAHQYDKDFKLNVVQMVLEQGKHAAQVARELGISLKTVYGWVAKYKEDPEHPCQRKRIGKEL
jgi:transposase